MYWKCVNLKKCSFQGTGKDVPLTFMSDVWSGMTHLHTLYDLHTLLLSTPHNICSWFVLLWYVKMSSWTRAVYSMELLHTFHAWSRFPHYNDVIMGAIASQNTSLTIVYSTVYSDADQRKHQSSESLAFVWGIHRGPVNSPHKWPVTRKMSPFHDVIMVFSQWLGLTLLSRWPSSVDWRICTL